MRLARRRRASVDLERAPLLLLQLINLLRDPPLFSTFRGDIWHTEKRQEKKGSPLGSPALFDFSALFLPFFCVPNVACLHVHIPRNMILTPPFAAAAAPSPWCQSTAACDELLPASIACILLPIGRMTCILLLAKGPLTKL